MNSRRLAALVAATALVMASAPAFASAPPQLEGVPHYDHIVVLTEENENATATWGTTSPATYLNGTLRPEGVFLPNYYGTGHVSLDNYLAEVSGQPNNVLSNTDCLTVSLWTCSQVASAFDGGQNLADQLEANGLSWNSWIDATSAPCIHGPYTAGDPSPDPDQGDGNTPGPAGPNYADRHNPFIYFSDFVSSQSRCAKHQLAFSDLASALAGGSATWTAKTLPAFSFITPDTCHDGHDQPTCADGQTGGLVAMDAWLKSNIGPLVSYLKSHDGLLVINFDESNPEAPSADSASPCTTCAGAGVGGRVGALLLGVDLAAGTTDSTGYDHYSLLRTIEDGLGISQHLGLAAVAQPMTDAFQH